MRAWAAFFLLLSGCDQSTPKIYGPTFDAMSDSQGANDAGGGDVVTDAVQNDSTSGCTSITAVLAGSSFMLVGASRTGTSAFKVDPLSGTMIDRPALVPWGNGFAGVLRASNDTVQSTVMSAAFTDPSLIGSAVTRDAPAIASNGSIAHLVFQAKSGNMNVDYKYFHGQLAMSMWDAADDPVGGSGNKQSYGPRAPTCAMSGNDLVVVQAGDNSILYDQIWNGSWQNASAHNNAAIQKSIPPVITTLSNGDLLVVYARDQDFKIMSTVRSNNTWSTPLLVDANAFLSGSTNEPVALAATSSGAVMVYRGTDAKAYFSLFDGQKWTAPVALSTSTVDSLPSVARGVCGTDAVVAYVESSAGVKIATLSSGTWSMPESLAMTASAKYVAIATRP